MLQKDLRALQPEILLAMALVRLEFSSWISPEKRKSFAGFELGLTGLLSCGQCDRRAGCLRRFIDVSWLQCVSNECAYMHCTELCWLSRSGHEPSGRRDSHLASGPLITRR